MPYILQTDRLTKIIGEKELVRDVDLHVRKGEIYGFLGPNGAGKTTVMKLVTNLWKPTGGRVLLFGEPLTPTSYGVLKRMGSIIEFPTFYPHMTGRENLQIHCDYMGYSRPKGVEEALEQLELDDAADRPVGSYSLGMKQRLGIAQAMLNDPEVLVLDEPTAGLDPKERVRFRNLISSFSKDKIVLLSTHIVSDIEYIANEILVMKSGKLIHQGKPEAVTKEITGYVWECRVPAGEAEHWNEKYTIGNLRNDGEYSVLRVISEKRPAGNAVPVKPVLEDLYLYYFEEEND